MKFQCQPLLRDSSTSDKAGVALRHVYDSNGASQLMGVLSLEAAEELAADLNRAVYASRRSFFGHNPNLTPGDKLRTRYDLRVGDGFVVKHKYEPTTTNMFDFPAGTVFTVVQDEFTLVIKADNRQLYDKVNLQYSDVNEFFEKVEGPNAPGQRSDPGTPAGTA